MDTLVSNMKFEIYNDRLTTLHGATPSGYIFMDADELANCNNHNEVLKLVRNRLNDFVLDVYSGKTRHQIYTEGYHDGLTAE